MFQHLRNLFQDLRVDAPNWLRGRDLDTIPLYLDYELSALVNVLDLAACAVSDAFDEHVPVAVQGSRPGHALGGLLTRTATGTTRLWLRINDRWNRNIAAREARKRVWS